MADRRLVLIPALLAAAALLAGCAGLAPPPPVLELPAGTATAPLELSRWWQSFEDPVLDKLAERALAANDDVLLAAARLETARATLGVARTNLFPGLGARFEPSREQSSTLASRPLFDGQPRTSSNHRLGFAATWEIDLWGRLATAREAARARLAASAYAREGTASAVTAEVARSYFTLRALDAEVELLERTLATRERSLELQRLRLEAGLIDAYVVSLAEAERSTVAAALPGLQSARDEAEIALATLAGASPRELALGEMARGAELAKLAAVPEIPAELPSDLLLRRPDVRAAEAQLAAAALDVVEARRRWLPAISLTGFFGGESKALENVLKGAAGTWNVAAVVAQPLLGLARIKADAAVARSRQVEAEITYQQAARQAYADALKALAAHRGARESAVAAADRLRAQSRVRELAQIQLDAGLTSLLDLLDAERERLAAARALVTAERDQLNALVDVYQALGGGWTLSASPPAGLPDLEDGR